MWLDVNGKRCQTGIDLDHDLHDGEVHFLRLDVPDAAARRHHHHGHPARRRRRHEAAAFLNVGDVVTLGIEGLGEQRQEIIAA